MTVMACGTGTLGHGLSGSPLTPEAVPASSPSTRPLRVMSSPTAWPAPSSTPEPVVVEPAAVSPSAVGVVTTTTAAPVAFDPAVEAWRSFVAVWFRSEHVDLVLALIGCESSGRADAVNDTPARNGMTAVGLLQHLDGYWPSRAIKANEAGYRNSGDIFNPFDQLAVSAWLAYSTQQGFDHWECFDQEAAS